MGEAVVTVLEPGPGETPLQALLREQGKAAKVFEWDESELVPCSPREMRDGLRESMRIAREKGWIPVEDPGCQCFVCRLFRKDM